MKKIFLFLFLSLAFLVQGKTITFEYNSLENASQTLEGISIIVEKGKGSVSPAYYSNGLRTYALNTITVTAPENERIAKIEISGTTSNNGNITCDKFGYDGYIKAWAGVPTNNIVFTRENGSGYLALKSITVTVYQVEALINDVEYEFNENDKSATLVAMNTSFSGALSIPETIEYNNSTYTVTEIGCSAFNSCSRLTSLTIPKTVNDIVSETFTGCTSLRILNISDGETPIKLDPEMYGGMFTGIPLETLYLGRTCYNNASSAGGSPFANLKKLKEVTIGNSVTSIGDYAFYRCTGLTRVTIPNSVTTIGNFAFYECSGLSGTLDLPDSLTTIGKYAFYYCSGLSGTLDLPDSLTTIGTSAFYYCSGLSGTLEIPNSVITIPELAFYGCSGLTGVIIPSSVTSISDNVFLKCSSVKYLNIEDGNTPLSLGFYNWAGGGEGLFVDCPIETLYIGRDLSYSTGSKYGYSPFYKNQSIQTLTFSKSVSAIGEMAFYGCSSLTNVTIPSSVTSIGEQAFTDCPIETLDINTFSIKDWFNVHSNLKSLVIGDYVTSIESNAFVNCTSLTTLSIGSSVTEIGENAFSGCRSLSGTLTLPSSVTSIGNSAFSGCSGLTGTLTIPSAVTSIGNSAFSGCSGLTGTLTIPSAVPSIGDSAFSGCSGLTSVTIGNSVTSVGDYAFDQCNNLKELYIGEKVNSIGTNAFANSKLLEEIVCASLIPPTAQKDVFSDFTYTYATLFVPERTLNAYSLLEPWNNFLTFKKLDEYDGDLIPGTATGITLNKSELTLLVGEEETLIATLTPEDSSSAIIWSVEEDGKSVVTVNQSGKITAVAPGTAIVLATAGRVSASCTVTVEADDTPVEVPATGITITPSAPVELKIGESLQLTATVSPENATDKSVTWESSDTNVATVSEQGLVTAIAPGTAVITASDAYGHNALVIVTVKADDTPVEVPATGITITPSAPTELKVGESLQLTATVSPENASDKSVTWESSDNNVATVSEQGLVSAIAPGTAVITASDAYGHNAFVMITVIDNEEDGVEAIFDDFSNLDIFNVNGVLIKKNATREDIDSLLPGLYIINGKKIVR